MESFSLGDSREKEEEFRRRGREENEGNLKARGKENKEI
jgi:hypothetical protein